MKRQYDKEFKMDAARLVVEAGKTAAQVVRDLDIAEQTLHNWIKKYKEDKDGSSFIGSGHSAPEKEAMLDLQKKVRDLEEKNAILK